MDGVSKGVVNPFGQGRGQCPACEVPLPEAPTVRRAGLYCCRRLDIWRIRRSSPQPLPLLNEILLPGTQVLRQSRFHRGIQITALIRVLQLRHLQLPQPKNAAPFVFCRMCGCGILAGVVGFLRGS